MVHSGGFYIVDKQKGRELPPQTLHWFKWEAALTWLSGIAAARPRLLQRRADVATIAPMLQRRARSDQHRRLIVVGWIVYDLLWISPLREVRDGSASSISYCCWSARSTASRASSAAAPPTCRSARCSARSWPRTSGCASFPRSGSSSPPTKAGQRARHAPRRARQEALQAQHLHGRAGRASS